MDYKHKSGSEKRKQKAEKDQKDQKLLSKIPKLTTIFSKYLQISSGSETTSECFLGTQDADTTNESFSDSQYFDTIDELPEDTNTTTEIDQQFGNADAITESDTHSMHSGIADIETPSTSTDASFQFSKSIGSQSIFKNVHSNDPGLWPVEQNQTILQNYWTKKGTMLLT